MLQSSLMSGGAFSVLQPGSSVATALSDGESKKKHVFVLEIREKKWRTIKIPLETVRPFVFDSVSLSNQSSVNPGNPETVQAFLTKKVEQMIDQANRERGSESPELPLIRLRVDYSGFSTINTQVFAQQFVNKVANPQDLMLWQKAPRKVIKNNMTSRDIIPTTGEMRIEDLIKEHLNNDLEILPEIELGYALDEYVQKDEKSALVDTVRKALTETKKDAENETKKKTTEHIQMDEEKKIIAEAIQSAAVRRKNRIHAEEVMKAAKHKLNQFDTILDETQQKEEHLRGIHTQTQSPGRTAPATLDLSSDKPEAFQKAIQKRSRLDSEVQIDMQGSPNAKQRMSKNVGRRAKTRSNAKGDTSELTSAQTGSRISTRAKALAGLRASSVPNGTTKSTESKWGSLKK